MNRLVGIRGLSGSGKSRLRELLFGQAFIHLEADMWMMEHGRYNFRPELLPANHAACLRMAEDALSRRHDVVVANTFTTVDELRPYMQAAKQYGAQLVILSLFDSGLSDEQLAIRNTHGVPACAIARQRSRWQRITGEVHVRP